MEKKLNPKRLLTLNPNPKKSGEEPLLTSNNKRRRRLEEICHSDKSTLMHLLTRDSPPSREKRKNFLPSKRNNPKRRPRKPRRTLFPSTKFCLSSLRRRKDLPEKIDPEEETEEEENPTKLEKREDQLPTKLHPSWMTSPLFPRLKFKLAHPSVFVIKNLGCLMVPQ